jgi:hypothetical protein
VLRDFDLAAAIDDEVLLITSTDAAEKLMKLRVYPVRDLLSVPGQDGAPGLRDDVERLEEVIQSATGQNNWSNTVGVRSIHWFPHAAVLVIAQTEAMHERVTELLIKLRACRDKQFPPKPVCAATDGGCST